MAEICEHLRDARPRAANSEGCEDCVKIGAQWVHLRECLTCGHVGCCDSSRHTHATKHYRATHHPVIQSAQPNESWLWCYVDEEMAQ